MTIDIDDMLGMAPAKKRRKARSSRGPLHDLLTQALPDFMHARDGVCDLDRLAEKLDMTRQGVYKWFKPGRANRIPAKQVEEIVKLSANQRKRGREFVPATREDFWQFLS
ncbi:helix-turn-helix domain-containing protein [Mesorhizobium sp. B2-8-9]|uniref:helix-turn-helix domain-containing protein n=1 Tax=Mesorhizobium sp. B2-8-9 TaxID=2589899 RepID=UPI00112C8FEA|nr:helix-turn-helix domain-containing protein [Mesorhizobium sp. B2-8-9]TPI86426.1 helix-turn-helix domain-containing protein [Mesorhizobium sp. B2-8-9]